jgi:hypothetical protein
MQLSPIAQALLLWNQMAFIPSQSIHHSVLLCLEVLHFARLASLPIVFLQVDCNKAYDKVKWSFLCELFAVMRFLRNSSFY